MLRAKSYSSLAGINAAKQQQGQTKEPGYAELAARERQMHYGVCVEEQHSPQHTNRALSLSPRPSSQLLEQYETVTTRATTPHTTISVGATPQNKAKSSDVLAAQSIANGSIRSMTELGDKLRASKLLQLKTTASQRSSIPSSRAIPVATQPSRKPAGPSSRPLLLSAVLSQQPQLFDRGRIAAVEKFVTHVDTLPARYQSAQVVFLSKNSLVSVDSISQFKQVRVLSLADNLIMDLEMVLDEVSQLNCLEALTLEGNPCSNTPYYRSRTLARLPGLKLLDSKPVTSSEAAAARLSVDQEQAYLAVMMQNACTVHKLAMVFKMQQVHREMFSMLYGSKPWLVRATAPSEVPVNPQKLLELWDYEGSLNTPERAALQGALRREVARRRQPMMDPPCDSTARDWRDAVTEVMSCQQRATAQLLEMVNEGKLYLQQEVNHRVLDPIVQQSVEESERKARSMQRDREMLMSGYRQAVQQLSPGSKVMMRTHQPDQISSHRPPVDASSPTHLRGQATRVLFGVTQGSPTRTHVPPGRKLEIETKSRLQASCGNMGSRQMPCTDDPYDIRTSSGRIQAVYDRPASATIMSGTARAQSVASTRVYPRCASARMEDACQHMHEKAGDKNNNNSRPARPRSAEPAVRGRSSSRLHSQGRGRGRGMSESRLKLSLRRAARQTDDDHTGTQYATKPLHPVGWKASSRSPTRGQTPPPLPWASDKNKSQSQADNQHDFTLYPRSDSPATEQQTETTVYVTHGQHHASSQPNHVQGSEEYHVEVVTPQMTAEREQLAELLQSTAQLQQLSQRMRALQSAINQQSTEPNASSQQFPPALNAPQAGSSRSDELSQMQFNDQPQDGSEHSTVDGTVETLIEDPSLSFQPNITPPPLPHPLPNKLKQVPHEYASTVFPALISNNLPVTNTPLYSAERSVARHEYVAWQDPAPIPLCMRSQVPRDVTHTWLPDQGSESSLEEMQDLQSNSLHRHAIAGQPAASYQATFRPNQFAQVQQVDAGKNLSTRDSKAIIPKSKHADSASDVADRSEDVQEVHIHLYPSPTQSPRDHHTNVTSQNCCNPGNVDHLRHSLEMAAQPVNMVCSDRSAGLPQALAGLLASGQAAYEFVHRVTPVTMASTHKPACHGVTASCDAMNGDLVTEASLSTDLHAKGTHTASRNTENTQAMGQCKPCLPQDNVCQSGPARAAGHGAQHTHPTDADAASNPPGMPRSSTFPAARALSTGQQYFMADATAGTRQLSNTIPANAASGCQSVIASQQAAAASSLENQMQKDIAQIPTAIDDSAMIQQPTTAQGPATKGLSSTYTTQAPHQRVDLMPQALTRSQSNVRSTSQARPGLSILTRGHSASTTTMHQGQYHDTQPLLKDVRNATTMRQPPSPHSVLRPATPTANQSPSPMVQPNIHPTQPVGYLARPVSAGPQHVKSLPTSTRDIRPSVDSSLSRLQRAMATSYNTRGGSTISVPISERRVPTNTTGQQFDLDKAMAEISINLNECESGATDPTQAMLPHTMTGLAAKELERELVSAALENSALQHALIAEQGEGALLRQELTVQLESGMTLETALAEASQELQDAKDALVLQSGNCEELQSTCNSMKQQEIFLRQQLQQAMDQLALLQDTTARQQAELVAVVGQHHHMMTKLQLDSKREEDVEGLAWRSLAKRALHALRRGATVARINRMNKAAADRVASRWTGRRVMIALRAHVQRSRIIQSMASMCGMHSLKRMFHGWRAVAQSHMCAAEHLDPVTLRTAYDHFTKLLLRKTLEAWRDAIHLEQPQTISKDRARQVYQDHLRRAAWAAWHLHCIRQQLKKSAVRRACCRYSRTVKNKVWAAWEMFMELRHRKRQVMSTAVVHRRHMLLHAWAQAVRRMTNIQQQVAAMHVRHNQHLKRRLLLGWKRYTRQQAKLAGYEVIALQHWQQGLQARYFCRWAAVTRKSVAEMTEVQGMLELQQALQVAVRWRCMSAAVQRQAAVVERGARMHTKRVVYKLMSTAFKGWHQLVANTRHARATTAEAFTQALVVHHEHTTLLRAFYGWHRLIVPHLRQLAATAQGLHASATKQLGELQRQTADALAVKDEALNQAAALQAAAALVPALQEELEISRGEARELEAKLLVSEKNCRQTAAERDGTQAQLSVTNDQLQETMSQLDAAKAEIVSLQASMNSAREAVRDLQLRIAQQVTKAAQVADAAQLELSARDRDLVVAKAAVMRAEKETATQKAELQHLRAQVSTLTAELSHEQSRVQTLVACMEGRTVAQDVSVVAQHTAAAQLWVHTEPCGTTSQTVVVSSPMRNANCNQAQMQSSEGFRYEPTCTQSMLSEPGHKEHQVPFYLSATVTNSPTAAKGNVSDGTHHMMSLQVPEQHKLLAGDITNQHSDSITGFLAAHLAHAST